MNHRTSAAFNLLPRISPFSGEVGVGIVRYLLSLSYTCSPSTLHCSPSTLAADPPDRLGLPANPDRDALSGVVEARAQDSATDRAALVALYNATDGANWTNNTNWLSDEPLSEWHGVTASNGWVTGLRLANNQLTGSIPTQLGSLSNLSRLILDGNQLTEGIPTQLGNLSNLEILKLARNRLTGTIPASLGNLANLQWLWLTNNQLTGSTPASLDNLANLEMLRLGSNRLTGPLPRSLTSLDNLRWISFRQNIPNGLCAPTDTAFQNWLQAIEIFEGGPNCSADNYSIPGKTTLTYPKAGSTLDDLIARVAAGEIGAEDAAAEAPLYRGDAIAVTIYLSGNVNGVVSFLQTNNVNPSNQGTDYIEAFVPIRLLGTLSQQTGVLRMRMIQPPQENQVFEQRSRQRPPGAWFAGLERGRIRRLGRQSRGHRRRVRWPERSAGHRGAADRKGQVLQV